MTPWWLITLGGLLGSAHCVGMCGGFAMACGTGPDRLQSRVTSVTWVGAPSPVTPDPIG